MVMLARWWGWKLLIKDDAEVLAMWRVAITAEPHKHKADTDNVSIIPEHGNSKAYTLARLARERPDLLEAEAKERQRAAQNNDAGRAVKEKIPEQAKGQARDHAAKLVRVSEDKKPPLGGRGVSLRTFTFGAPFQ